MIGVKINLCLLANEGKIIIKKKKHKVIRSRLFDLETLIQIAFYKGGARGECCA
jgi:hypothetical protein